MLAASSASRQLTTDENESRFSCQRSRLEGLDLIQLESNRGMSVLVIPLLQKLLPLGMVELPLRHVCRDELTQFQAVLAIPASNNPGLMLLNVDMLLDLRLAVGSHFFPRCSRTHPWTGYRSRTVSQKRATAYE